MSQPPPRKIPLKYLKDPKQADYENKQMAALYHLWQLVKEIPGLTTPYPISDGGTGATTPAGARANMDVYSTSEVDALIVDGRRYALLVS